MKKLSNIGGFKNLIYGLVLTVVSLLCAFESQAQQDPMYTQYMENMMMINPAYAGSKDLLSMLVMARNQWVSMPGAPKTRTFIAHSPLTNARMGLGLSFLSDHVGPIKQSGIYADYSYQLYFSNKRTLALGMKAGVNFYEAGVSDLLTNDPNDPVFAFDINRNFLPNFGVGAFFHTDKYYLGLSIPKLIENTINKNGVSVQNISRERLHIFFMAGYVFDVNRIVKFKPSILTKYVKNAPVSVDATGTFLFYEKLWVGAMYRVGDAFGGLCQLQVTDQIKIGYSYDLPVNRLGAFNNGTHEILVGFDFSLVRGRVRSPRYF